MRHRPLFWVAIAFASGIACTAAWPVPSKAAGAFAAALGLSGLLLWHLRKGDCLQTPLTLLFLTVLGAFHASLQDLPPANPIESVCPGRQAVLLRLEGRVCSRPRILETGSEEHFTTAPGRPDTLTRFLLARITVPVADTGEFRTFDGFVQVTVLEGMEDIRYGDHVRCLGWLARPRGPSNPGEFDVADHLFRTGVRACLRIRDARNCQVMSRGQGLRLVALLLGLNQACRGSLYEHLKPREAALLDGLLLGNRERLTPETDEAFLLTGTRHVLSISGLHVALVTGTVLGVLRLARCPVVVSHPLSVLFAFFYAFFTGGGAPSLRAAVMLGVFLLAPLLRRGSDPLNLLGLSALILLGADPGQLFNLGFQLSFLAILGMLLLVNDLLRLARPPTLAEQVLERLHRFSFGREARRYLTLSLAVSAAAWTATLGLVALHFHVVTPVALAANLVICPLVFLILAAGLIALPLALLLPPVGVPFLAVTGILAWSLEKLVRLFALIPFGHLFVARLHAGSVVLYYAFLLVMALRPVFSWRYRCVFAAGGLFLALHLLFFGNPSHRPAGTMRLSVLSVGHGCAALLELPDGRSVLYDVGSRARVDVTARVVAPFLWHRGLSRLDGVVLSHLDQDHYSGFSTLLRRFRVREVIVPAGFSAAGPGRNLLALAHDAGCTLKTVAAGEVILHGPGWKIAVLGPPADAEASLSDNDRSLVLRARLDRVSFLLCGDIEEKGTELLLGSVNSSGLQADALLVPHHGAASPRNGDLAQRVRPRFAVVSAWEQETSEETLASYRRLGAEVLVTGREGAVSIRTDGSHLEVETFVPR